MSAFLCFATRSVMWGDVESEKDLEKWKNRSMKRARDLANREVSEGELDVDTNPLIGSLVEQEGNSLIC